MNHCQGIRYWFYAYGALLWGSGDSKSVIKGLVQTAKKWGANPKEWYVVYEDVLLSNISLIQMWNSEEWISMMKGG